jgi:hypothetical protein
MNDKQNIFNLAYHYTRALSRWIKAGRPVRGEAEIKLIFETFCQPCDAYESGRCGYCGCYVNQKTIAPLNKIAMATEECPLHKWKNNSD